MRIPRQTSLQNLNTGSESNPRTHTHKTGFSEFNTISRFDSNLECRYSDRSPEILPRQNHALYDMGVVTVWS